MYPLFIMLFKTVTRLRNDCWVTKPRVKGDCLKLRTFLSVNSTQEGHCHHVDQNANFPLKLRGNSIKGDGADATCLFKIFISSNFFMRFKVMTISFFVLTGEIIRTA